MDRGKYLAHPRASGRRRGKTAPVHASPIHWLSVPDPTVRAGLSMRIGGVSAPPFESLNLGGSTADTPASLAENRRRFYAAAGLDPDRVARMHQVHGARVVTVSAPGLVGEADGLVSATCDLALLVAVADCLPIFLVDVAAGVIGALHVGWRGLLAGVIEAGIEAAGAAGADPGEIAVVMGPAIGACCFEVGPEVALRFDQRTHRPGRRGRPHLDLAHAVRLRLAALGVRDNAIRDPEACTRCRTDVYFSARSGEPTGRMVGFIIRREGSPG